MSETLENQTQELIAKLVEPLNLDRWTIKLQTGKLEEDSGRACCSAMPEYSEALICFDFDKLQTGDVLDEIMVHELTHCHIWPIHELAEVLAQTLAASAPAHLQEPLKALLERQVEIAAEATTTSVAFVLLKLLRRAKILATPGQL